jgi:transposase
MAWTEFTRSQHRRKTKRYPSDLTDGEWKIVRQLLPGRNRLGRPRKVALRRVWNAIQYLAAAGCAWSLLPKDFPPVSTVRYYFYRWRDDGLLAEINRHLVAAARLAAGRDVQPTAGVIDSQSVKTSENTSLSGYDAGKRIKGRKRHIITDTCGNLIACEVHTANIQDRDGAPRVFARLRREAPKLRHMFADGGYAGPKLRGALVSPGRWTLDAGRCRSASAPTPSRASRCCHADGSWSALSHGSVAAVVWRRIGRNLSRAPRLGLLIAHIRRVTRLLATD